MLITVCSWLIVVTAVMGWVRAGMEVVIGMQAGHSLDGLVACRGDAGALLDTRVVHLPECQVIH